MIYSLVSFGRLAQLVEHLLDTQVVTGSSPVPSTIFIFAPIKLSKTLKSRMIRYVCIIVLARKTIEKSHCMLNRHCLSEKHDEILVLLIPSKINPH